MMRLWIALARSRYLAAPGSCAQDATRVALTRAAAATMVTLSAFMPGQYTPHRRRRVYNSPNVSRARASMRRILLVALVLCATICAQSAALTEEQETHQGSDHCCGLCHLGPAPVLPSAVSAMV